MRGTESKHRYRRMYTAIDSKIIYIYIKKCPIVLRKRNRLTKNAF